MNVTRIPDQNGVYYTPPSLVRLIVPPLLRRLLAGRTPRQTAGLTVLDPACGGGAFLVAAYQHLLRWYRARYREAEPRRLIQDARGIRRWSPSERARILRRHIFGVDIDPAAVAVTRTALSRLACGDATAVSLDDNIRCGDALLGPDSPAAARGAGTPFDWDTAFPHVRRRGGFRAVIGNPPWVSLAGRFGVGGYPAAHVAYLVRRFGGNTYLPNLYEFFVALGLELAAPGGYVSFLVPDRLGYNGSLRGLRERLLTETRLVSLLYHVPFPGVTADTLVFLLRKGRAASATPVTVAEFGRPRVRCRQADFQHDPARAFRCPPGAALRRVLEKMESATNVAPLGEICASTSGFGGRAECLTVARSSPRQIPVLKGESIRRYAVDKIYWFDFARPNLTGRTVDPAKLGAAPKILLRKTGDRLIAAYDASGTFPEQSLYFLYRNRSGLDWKFLLGVLNSRPATLYFRTRLLTNPRSIAQVKKADLDRLPVPRLELTQPHARARHDRLVTLVEQLLPLHRGAEAEAATGQRDRLEREVDRLVQDLYGLTEAEVAAAGQRTSTEP